MLRIFESAVLKNRRWRPEDVLQREAKRIAMVVARAKKSGGWRIAVVGGVSTKLYLGDW